jgi:rhodanese-related sulfurtransferase
MTGSSQTAQSIDAQRLSEWMAEQPDLQVIDVREGYEREAGHITGSRHVELAALTGQAATVERERPVVFYCRVGGRSAMAAEAFAGAGYDAYTLEGGLLDWAARGLPLEPDGGTVADH